MEYFRKYLIQIRKYSNTEMKPHFMIRLILITFIGFIGGVLLDKLLPFSIIFNTLRSLIALITGLTLGSYLFLLNNNLKNERLITDKYYIPLRKRFSFNQRINIAIIIGVCVATFMLLSNKHNLLFTLKTSLAVSIAFLLLSFVRRNRNEFLKEIYEIPDLRDLEFQEKKNERLRKQKEVNKEPELEKGEPKKSKKPKSTKWYNKLKGKIKEGD